MIQRMTDIGQDGDRQGIEGEHGQVVDDHLQQTQRLDSSTEQRLDSSHGSLQDYKIVSGDKQGDGDGYKRSS